VDGQHIRVFAEKEPALIPWKSVNAEYVVESTGLFLTKEKAQGHIDAGAKKVIQSAPSKDDTPMFVWASTTRPTPAMTIVSNASCTTNCLAPVAKVLNDNWGIKRGLMTTVHAATATQKTVDGPSNKDWRGGRGILEQHHPLLHRRRQGRGRGDPRAEQASSPACPSACPPLDVSVVDLTVELEKPATYEEICAAMKAASKAP
jgi:glyceraldehyde 3-phosphate dehydrogenase